MENIPPWGGGISANLIWGEKYEKAKRKRENEKGRKGKENEKREVKG
jgi:hypothetical protein